MPLPTLPASAQGALPPREPPRIATAGGSIPRAVADAFPQEGSRLQRYAARFAAVEINSTFYRSHKPQTFARWAAATPPDFRFALKLPRAITHAARLAGADALVDRFLAEASALGDKLGPLLVQLAPSLAFDPAASEPFLRRLAQLWPTSIACEPRHPSWFESEAEALLTACRTARVAADPPRHAAGGASGGWPDLAYWRLHGAPVVYRSPYAPAALEALAAQIAASPAPERWCVFDNTALVAAAADALALQGLVG